MRIPDAYSAGFGQRSAPAGQVVFPNTAGDEAIAAGGEKLSKSLLGAAVEEKQFQGRVDLMNATAEVEAQQRQEREAAAEQKHLESVQAQSSAQLKFLEYEDYLTQAAGVIAQNPDLTDPQAKQAAFTETAAEVKKSFLQEIPDPLLQAQMEPTIVEKTMRARTVLNDYLAKESADQIRATQVAAIDVIHRSSRPLEEKLGLIDNLDLSSYTEEQQAKVRADARDKATFAAVKERFLKDDPHAVLTDLSARTDQGDPVKYPWLNQETRLSLEEHATGLIQRQEAERARAARETQALADQQRHNAFTSAVEMVKAGYPIPIDLDVKLRSTFRGTEYAGMYNALNQKANSFEFRQELLNKDPLTYYARQNGLDIHPIDVTRPLQPQMEARIPLAREAQKKLGLPFAPILLEGEIKALGQQMKVMDGQGRAQLGLVLGTVYGKQGAGYIAAQLAGGQGDVKDGVLGLTVALSASGKIGAATLVGHGSDLLKAEKTVYDSTTKKNITAQFDSLAGSAWKGYRIETRDAYQQGVTAAYTALLRAQGGDPAVFDKGLYKQAFKAVVGETGYINGKTTVLPDGWTEDTMLNSLKQLTPETVNRSGGVMDTRTGKIQDPAAMAKRIRTEGSLWEAGNGTYYVQLDGAQLMSGNRDDRGRPVPFRLRFGE